jgi:hypothetical protein
VKKDDRNSRFSWLAEGNAKQARKRVAAKVVIRDQTGRILLVNPTYKEDWDLPGEWSRRTSPRVWPQNEKLPNSSAFRRRSITYSGSVGLGYTGHGMTIWSSHLTVESSSTPRSKN